MIRSGSDVAADAALLVAAYRAELDALLPGAFGDSAPVELDDADVFVSYCEGQPVAVAALRLLAHQVGEVKQMYVVPPARGQGLARALLAHLELVARSRGWKLLRLDTAEELAAARLLYERAGYRSIPRYNDNPFARYWYEKWLAGAGWEAPGGAAPG